MRKVIGDVEHKDCGGKRGCGQFFPATTRFFGDRKTRYTNKDGELIKYDTLSTMCLPCEAKAANERNAKRSYKALPRRSKLSYDYASAVHIDRNWNVVRLSA